LRRGVASGGGFCWGRPWFGGLCCGPPCCGGFCCGQPCCGGLGCGQPCCGGLGCGQPCCGGLGCGQLCSGGFCCGQPCCGQACCGQPGCPPYPPVRSSCLCRRRLTSPTISVIKPAISSSTPMMTMEPASTTPCAIDFPNATVASLAGAGLWPN